MNYTQKDIDEAMEYLRRRVDSELSMHNDVERLLGEYALLLIDIMMRDKDYESNPDVELLVRDLIDRILSDCYLLGVDERRESQEDIIAYMDSERAGRTLRGRVVERCHSFVHEVASTVISGVALGKGIEVIKKDFLGNMKTPWESGLILEAGIVTEVPSFGRGEAISSLIALQTITEYAVADAWMWSLFQDNKEANGYYVFRGSSYPCDECDEAVNTGFHPMSDWVHFVPLHPHCKCFVVFVRQQT